jgi:hypothetical protein
MVHVIEHGGTWWNMEELNPIFMMKNLSSAMVLQMVP